MLYDYGKTNIKFFATGGDGMGGSKNKKANRLNLWYFI